MSKQAELQFAIDQQSLIIRAAEAYFDVLRGRDNLISSLAEEKAIKQQLKLLAILNGILMRFRTCKLVILVMNRI